MSCPAPAAAAAALPAPVAVVPARPTSRRAARAPVRPRRMLSSLQFLPLAFLGDATATVAIFSTVRKPAATDRDARAAIGKRKERRQRRSPFADTAMALWRACARSRMVRLQLRHRAAKRAVDRVAG